MPERRVIASLLTDNSLIRECELMAGDFTDNDCREVYTAIQVMAISRQPFDAVTLGDSLEQKTGRKWTGMLGRMVMDLPTTANFGAYQKIVRDKSRERKTQGIGQELVEGGDADTAITHLMAVNSEAKNNNTKVISAIKLAVEGIEEVANGKSPGVMTGLKDLDDCIGGFHQSDLIVIAGRPSMGKTAVALNMANSCRVPCGLISAEQSAEQVGQRMIAINGKVSVHKMRNGTLDKDDWKRAANVLSTMGDRDIYINDKPAITLADVQRTARYYKYNYDIKILYVDYLQKITTDAPNKREEISIVVIGLKNLARELDIPVVALAQVKRDVDTRTGNKRPYMGDLAESGVIEREADQIITLYRDEVYNPTGEKGVLELFVCKNRHGPLGTIKTVWIADFMRVEDYEERWLQ